MSDLNQRPKCGLSLLKRRPSIHVLPGRRCLFSQRLPRNTRTTCPMTWSRFNGTANPPFPQAPPHAHSPDRPPPPRPHVPPSRLRRSRRGPRRSPCRAGRCRAQRPLFRNQSHWKKNRRDGSRQTVPGTTRQSPTDSIRPIRPISHPKYPEKAPNHIAVASKESPHPRPPIAQRASRVRDDSCPAEAYSGPVRR